MSINSLISLSQTVGISNRIFALSFSVVLLSPPVVASDFVIHFNYCRNLIGSLLYDSRNSDSLKEGPAEPTWFECTRYGQKVLCDILDEKKKKFRDLTLLVGADVPPFLLLWTATRSDRVTIHQTQHSAGIVSNVADPDRPDLFGSKVCNGVYATTTELGVLPEKKKGK